MAFKRGVTVVMVRRSVWIQVFPDQARWYKGVGPKVMQVDGMQSFNSRDGG